MYRRGRLFARRFVALLGAALSTALVAAVAPAASVLTGCIDAADPYATPLSLSAPVAAAKGLVFHEEGRARLLRIDGVAEPKLASFPYGGTPARRGVTPDGATLLLLDRDARTLTAADVAGGRTTAYKLPSEFSGFVVEERQGEDPSQAVAVYHAAGGGGVSSLVNTAEVGLIDLSAAPGDGTNPRIATITGLSRAPLRAHVSPEITAADGPHRVVWIDAASMIGVADFAPGGKIRTRIIPLVAGDSTAVISPFRTVARVTGSVLDLYVIAIGSNDVLHIGMDLSATEPTTVLDQIASGAVPADIHVFDGKDGLRILTTNAKSRDLALLDPSTGTGTYVHLETLTDSIVPFASGGKPMAMLWRDGVHDFHIVDLDALEKKKGKAITRVRIDQPIHAVAIRGDKFLLTHAGDADRGLSLYDAATGKQTVFGGTGLVHFVVVQGAAVFAMGTVGGDTRLSRIALKDLHGTSISLKKHKATALLPYADAGIAAVGPGLGSWWLAVFAEGVLEAKKGVWIEGFALQGALK